MAVAGALFVTLVNFLAAVAARRESWDLESF